MKKMPKHDYLVILRCTLDDVPMRLFSDREAAWEFAESVDENSEAINEIEIDMPESDLCGVDVMTFVDGMPMRRVEVKSLVVGDDID